MQTEHTWGMISSLRDGCSSISLHWFSIIAYIHCWNLMKCWGNILPWIYWNILRGKANWRLEMNGRYLRFPGNPELSLKGWKYLLCKMVGGRDKKKWRTLEVLEIATNNLGTGKRLFNGQISFSSFSTEAIYSICSSTRNGCNGNDSISLDKVSVIGKSLFTERFA